MSKKQIIVITESNILKCTCDSVLEYTRLVVKVLVIDDLEKFSRSGYSACFDFGPDGQVVVVNFKCT